MQDASSAQSRDDVVDAEAARTSDVRADRSVFQGCASLSVLTLPAP